NMAGNRAAAVSADAGRIRTQADSILRKNTRLGVETHLGFCARWRRSAWIDLGRHDARRPLQIGKQWRLVGTESPTLGPPEARRVGGRTARSGRASIPSASIRATRVT